ncbi:MAG: GrpB family protein [Gammaproteobacteria bacterium]|nr:GrpB family protein [Gammaproteobacteria bacterium]
MRFLDPHQYQAEIGRLFEVVAKEVSRLLPNANIEHIGASAIPGAVSKGDLDVFVGVDEHELEKAVHCLERNGYRVKTDTLKNESLCMLESSSYEYPVALQVVANGSEFEMFLTFRDALRANDNLLKEYNQMKHLCEGMSETRYRNRKSAFIEKVLASLQD